jgi:ABC-type transport system involved in multi-copper enzyme maturation permease subunit
MLFAGLVLEREPLQWAQLIGAGLLWVQNAGSVAAFGLGIWLLAQTLQRGQPMAGLLSDAPRSVARPLSKVLTFVAWVSFLGFLSIGMISFISVYSPAFKEKWMPAAGRLPRLTYGDTILGLSGLLALLVVLTPLLLGLFRLQPRRIWALARLSIKEAIRSRVVLVFGFIALIFLFAEWFVPYRAEDQVRNYVRVVYWSITPLFLITAGLLGSMSIPTDIKNQSIHTIVTKPVEKFEIVLGRFLGYGLLLTAGLALVSLLSLTYVVRGVNEQARQESFKARVPIFVRLDLDRWGFINTKGESVGREWDYRRYIGGPHQGGKDAPQQYAVWGFDEVPAELAERNEPVTFEFTFDIFRLSKGEENKDIPCTFTFVAGNVNMADLKTQLDKLKEERANNPDEDALINKYGIYEIGGVEVTDYHTQSRTISPTFIRKVLADAGKRTDEKAPLMYVLVSVDRAAETQMLGVAARDLYLLATEKPFWVNFLKGIVGMWCTHMLVLGIAVALSTYLSWIISFLCTMFLFVAGMFTEYLQALAANRIPGGGPAESALRVLTARPQAGQLDATPATAVLRGSDQVFTWVLERMLNLIPEINRFDLHNYVGNGFDVSVMNVLLIDNLIPMAGYLVPWAILAYYLMKYREIANPT